MSSWKNFSGPYLTHPGGVWKANAHPAVGEGGLELHRFEPEAEESDVETVQTDSRSIPNGRPRELLSSRQVVWPGSSFVSRRAKFALAGSRWNDGVGGGQFV